MKTLMLIFGCALAAYSQGTGSKQPLPNGDPANTYVNNPFGVRFHTDGIGVFIACDVIARSDGTFMPANGATATITTNTWLGSGWHSHENSTFIQPYRPQVIILDTQFTKTIGKDVDPTGTNSGCVSWNIQFPGIAGWYTVEAKFSTFTFDGETFIDTPNKGNNVYAEEFNSLQPNAPKGTYIPFDQYPDDGTNQPEAQYPDQGHNNEHWFFDPQVTIAIYGASFKYTRDMQAYYGATVPIPKVGVIRGSLPSGGVADNDPGSLQFGSGKGNFTGWTTRAFEEHSRGVEVDLHNDWYGPNPNNNLPFQAAIIMYKAFATYRCYPGNDSPGSGLPLGAPNSYWLEKSYTHMSCSQARRLPSVINQ